ncbi:MAG TPA: MFS transporter [Rhizomicrobium sp.]|nr:MFS transporter [Rhizomicrobium sp.]
MSAADAARARNSSLVAILATCAASGIGTGLTLPLLGLILERRGYPGTVNGLNLATAGLAAVLVTPHVPRWIQKYGASQYLAFMLAVVAAAFVAIYEAPSLWFWFPIRFILSAALNSLFVVSEFWINQLADERNRGRMVALYTTCFSAGFAVGPVLLGIIGTRGIAPFLAGSGMMLVALVPILIVRRAAPRVEQPSRQPMLGLIRAAPAALLAAFVFGSIDAGMAGLLPVYGVRSGYSEAAAAMFVTAISVGGLLFQYPLGYLADHMSRRKLLLICAVSGVLGATLTPFAVHWPAAMYVLLALWGGIAMGIYTIGLTLVGERFKGRELVGANAANVILYSIGLLIGPAAEGIALDAWNPHGLLVALGGICAAYVLFLTFGRRAKL